jgi:hypothetical protein
VDVHISPFQGGGFLHFDGWFKTQLPGSRGEPIVLQRYSRKSKKSNKKTYLLENKRKIILSNCVKLLDWRTSRHIMINPYLPGIETNMDSVMDPERVFSDLGALIRL